MILTKIIWGDCVEREVELLKALADSSRLQILDMLSCGPMCACEIMKRLDLTQPTISHHMKILTSSGLVDVKKDGKWMNYSINKDSVNEIINYITYITNPKDDCICKRMIK
ncbi:winged helix-turn-helix transcriptional regulator [Soehngenia saccharolytica]|nr:winged helix-turn-helix transcriptional regulator [Soehngenia saccharolytica]